MKSHRFASGQLDKVFILFSCYWLTVKMFRTLGWLRMEQQKSLAATAVTRQTACLQTTVFGLVLAQRELSEIWKTNRKIVFCSGMQHYCSVCHTTVCCIVLILRAAVVEWARNAVFQNDILFHYSPFTLQQCKHKYCFCIFWYWSSSWTFLALLNWYFSTLFSFFRMWYIFSFVYSSNILWGLIAGAIMLKFRVALKTDEAHDIPHTTGLFFCVCVSEQRWQEWRVWSKFTLPPGLCAWKTSRVPCFTIVGSLSHVLH